jgi:hypothetical protein
LTASLLQASAANQDATTWFEITKGLIIPVALASAAGLVGLWRYIQDQRDRRRTHLRDVFSEALRAVADYQELPYLVRRRGDHTPMTPAEIAWHASEVQSRLDFYIARLRLEATQIGNSYERLVGITRQETGAHITEAWAQPRLDQDEDMPLQVRYSRDNADVERAACLNVMHTYLQ